jgi:hypothetical protein
MNTSRIDDAILAAAQKSWRKVAMIVAKTSEEDTGVPDDEEGHRVIASRIEALVQDGRLVAQGDLKKWRHSEVRRLHPTRRIQWTRRLRACFISCIFGGAPSDALRWTA